MVNQASPSKVDKIPDTRGPLKRLVQYLLAPIDGSSLAVFRMCFGALMLLNIYEYSPQLNDDYIKPVLHYTYIQGLTSLPAPLMSGLWNLMAVVSSGIALGFFYRASTLVFFASWTYFFLLDKAYFQNHWYLICLLSFMMFLIPANRVWSLDTSKEQKDSSVPRWSLMILKIQIALVYFYGAVAKLNSDWFRGVPVDGWLAGRINDPIIGQLCAQPWFSTVVVYGGICVDLSLACLLFWPQTYWLGVAMALAFHGFNSQMFNIGVFPWLMIAALGLFAPPDWPRKLLARFGVANDKPQRSYAAAAREARIGATAKSDEKQSQNDDEPVECNAFIFGKPKPSAEPKSAVYASSANPQHMLNICIISFLGIYLVWQVLFPLRRFFYEGNSAWTEQGNRFAWTMMLNSKKVSDFEMDVIDAKTGAKRPVDLEKLTSTRQILNMVNKPELIQQLAHYVANQKERETGVRPIVRAKVVASLNGRPFQDLIDPKVDLAAQPMDYKPKSWIVPLQNNQVGHQ